MFRSSILINYVCMSVFCCCYFHFSLCSCLQYSPKGPLHWPLHRFNHLRKPKYKWKKKIRGKKYKREEKYLELAFEFSEILVNFLEL